MFHVKHFRPKFAVNNFTHRERDEDFTTGAIHCAGLEIVTQCPSLSIIAMRTAQ